MSGQVFLNLALVVSLEMLLWAWITSIPDNAFSVGGIEVFKSL